MAGDPLEPAELEYDLIDLDYAADPNFEWLGIAHVRKLRELYTEAQTEEEKRPYKELLQRSDREDSYLMRILNDRETYYLKNPSMKPKPYGKGKRGGSSKSKQPYNPWADMTDPETSKKSKGRGRGGAPSQVTDWSVYNANRDKPSFSRLTNVPAPTPPPERESGTGTGQLQPPTLQHMSPSEMSAHMQLGRWNKMSSKSTSTATVNQSPGLSSQQEFREYSTSAATPIEFEKVDNDEDEVMEYDVGRSPRQDNLEQANMQAVIRASELEAQRNLVRDGENPQGDAVTAKPTEFQTPVTGVPPPPSPFADPSTESSFYLPTAPAMSKAPAIRNNLTKQERGIKPRRLQQQEKRERVNASERTSMSLYKTRMCKHWNPNPILDKCGWTKDGYSSSRCSYAHGPAELRENRPDVIPHFRPDGTNLEREEQQGKVWVCTGNEHPHLLPNWTPHEVSPTAGCRVPELCKAKMCKQLVNGNECGMHYLLHRLLVDVQTRGLEAVIECTLVKWELCPRLDQYDPTSDESSDDIICAEGFKCNFPHTHDEMELISVCYDDIATLAQIERDARSTSSAFIAQKFKELRDQGRSSSSTATPAVTAGGTVLAGTALGLGSTGAAASSPAYMNCATVVLSSFLGCFTGNHDKLEFSIDQCSCPRCPVELESYEEHSPWGFSIIECPVQALSLIHI